MPDLGSNLNRIFLEHLQDPDLKKQAEERSMAFLKQRIYEDSFMEKILPSRPISPSQCDRTESSSGSPSMLRKIIDKEYIDVTATAMDFRGKGDFRYVETDTYAVDFFKIESPEFTITEGELRAKEQPIQALLKHHTSRHIDEVIDRTFIAACEAAITASGQNIPAQADPTILPKNLTKLRNLIDGRDGRRPLRAATLLMTQAQFNTVFTWPQSAIDNGLKDDFWKDGYRYDMLAGLRIVTTNKTHLLANNRVLLFTAPEFLGHHFTFNDDRFQIRTEWDTIAWKAWKTHGAAIGNNYAVAGMTLTGSL
jgi:hypothetical protein